MHSNILKFKSFGCAFDFQIFGIDNTLMHKNFPQLCKHLTSRFRKLKDLKKGVFLTTIIQHPSKLMKTVRVKGQKLMFTKFPTQNMCKNFRTYGRFSMKLQYHFIIFESILQRFYENFRTYGSFSMKLQYHFIIFEAILQRFLRKLPYIR